MNNMCSESKSLASQYNLCTLLVILQSLDQMLGVSVTIRFVSNPPAFYFGHVLFVQCSWGARVNFRECCNASNLHLTGGFAACQQPHERVLSLTDILRCLELSPLLRQYKGICGGLMCALTPSSKQHFLCLEVTVITQINIYKEKQNMDFQCEG